MIDARISFSLDDLEKEWTEFDQICIYTELKHTPQLSLNMLGKVFYYDFFKVLLKRQVFFGGAWNP